MYTCKLRAFSHKTQKLPNYLSLAASGALTRLDTEQILGRNQKDHYIWTVVFTPFHFCAKNPNKCNQCDYGSSGAEKTEEALEEA